MKSLKESGVEEIRSLRRRTSRIYAMGRIYREDHDNIIAMCDELEATIINMHEEIPGRREF